MDATLEPLDSVRVDTPRAATRFSPMAIGLSLGLVAALAWAYRSSLSYLINWWEGDSNYSHGWLIVPISLAIAYQRRGTLSWSLVRPTWWGVLPLIALLVARFKLYEWNELWAETATLPLVVAAVTLAVGGHRLLWWAAPSLVYLIFMLPLPPQLNILLAWRLQRLATIGSVGLLKMTGYPVLAEGNVILIADQRLEVAEACRGLSMLLSFGALIVAMVILIRRPLWERVVLLLSIIPIALFCNIVRIAATAMIYAHFHRQVQAAHDFGGFAMMGLGLVLALLEMKLMSWLVIEERVGTRKGVLRTTYRSSAES